MGGFSSDVFNASRGKTQSWLGSAADSAAESGWPQKGRKRVQRPTGFDTEGAERVVDLHPDLLIVNRPAAFSNTDEVSSVVIVELKRPQRNDYSGEDNPITQVFEYIENIRHGKAHRSDGVALDIKRDTPFFVHIIADSSLTLKKQIQQANIFTPTADAGGYFGYAKEYNAYIEICSFEKLIRDAEKKNYVWFKHLGIA